MQRYGTLFSLAIFTLLAGCSDDAGSDTQSAPPATSTAPITTDPATTTTGDEDTTSTSTGTTSPTTGEETTTSTTGDDSGPVEPMQCIDDDATCEASAATWCEEAHALAVAHLPKTYSDITALNCREGAEACTLCFQIWNTCTQVGTDCDGLFEICGCLAQAHGEV